MDEFRIPTLVGGPLDGRPAPAKWLEGEEHPLWVYIDPDSAEAFHRGDPTAMHRVHNYTQERLLLGGRPEERGAPVVGLIFERHRAHAPRLFADRLIELAQRATARPTGPSGVKLLGYSAHLILMDDSGQQIEVPDWMRQSHSEYSFVVDAYRIKRAVDDALAVAAERVAMGRSMHKSLEER